jgi:multiple sugar transport system permease protein
MLHRRQHLTRILLLLPALVILVMLTIYPLVTVVYYSFFDYHYVRGFRGYVGLDNYRYLLGDLFFTVSVRNTVVFAALATAAQVLLGLGFALLFNRPFRGRQIAVPMMIFPMILSTMVVSAIWRAWFHYDYGFLNNLLRSVGLGGVRWLFDPDIALYSIVLVDMWQWTPMVFLILLAGLQSIPREYYEAAQIDGARALQVLTFVTLPLLKGHLFLAALLRTVDSFKLFDKVYALTGGGPGISTESISTYIYREGFRYFNVGLASAASIIMLGVALLLTLVYAAQVLRGQQR